MKRTYDPTVARMAGNIAAGMMGEVGSGAVPFDAVAVDAVALTRELIKEVIRTEPAETAEPGSDRAVMQQIMQVLGPHVLTEVDYTDPLNAAGLTYEVGEALRLLRAAGIEYKGRKKEREK